MSDIDRVPCNILRFPVPAQQRNRETLNDWYVRMVLEDRAEHAMPPLELIPVAGHG